MNKKLGLNPYDFVPFGDGPTLWSIGELGFFPEAEGAAERMRAAKDKEGPPYEDTSLVSGTIAVSMKALTPVIIAGSTEVNAGGKRINNISFYRESGVPCIPGSSIRGMLRSFIEALTNGWVSKVEKEVYEKQREKHHIGFALFKSTKSIHGAKRKAPRFRLLEGNQEPKIDNGETIVGPAVPPAYCPQLPKILNLEQPMDIKIDLATALFGIVVEKQEGGEKKTEEDDSRMGSTVKAGALGGRISIEDALVDPESLQVHYIPDVEKTAFMGGPKPSASSWWYMYPAAIRKRKARVKKEEYETLEFVGSGYRGRKFYYHHDPEDPHYGGDAECVVSSSSVSRYYKSNWPAGRKQLAPIYHVPVECLRQGSKVLFKISFRRLPWHLVRLIMLCLQPPSIDVPQMAEKNKKGKIHIAHKIGLGKPYGYGSVECQVERIDVFEHFSMRSNTTLMNGISRFTLQEKRLDIAVNWNDIGKDRWLKDVIDWKRLGQLLVILSWPPLHQVRFVYPPFAEGYFAQAVGYNKQFKRKMINTSDAEKVAECLLSTKRTIHFEVYKKNAHGYKALESRAEAINKAINKAINEAAPNSD